MKKIYLAPLEGVTDSIYRKTFMELYGGVDKVYTPFISPCETHKFTTREYRDIDPEINDIGITVPQLLTSNAEHFLWAAAEIAALGFSEINLNLGCPSGTVVAKKKGSGFIFYPEELDEFLYTIFDGLESRCAKKGAKAPNISIKTRLGKLSPNEFYKILEIYNKYPISELTIHPRVQTDFYKGPVRIECFDFAYDNSKIPLVYNGDIKTVRRVQELEKKYQDINAIMIGRGLIANPELALAVRSGALDMDFNYERLKEFHDSLLQQYTKLLSGDNPVLHRMKELWMFWQIAFPGREKALKEIKKSTSIQSYKISVANLFR